MLNGRGKRLARKLHLALFGFDDAQKIFKSSIRGKALQCSFGHRFRIVETALLNLLLDLFYRLAIGNGG